MESTSFNLGLAMLDDARGFREAAAAVSSVLLRRFGTHRLDLVEDAVQDAFVAATRRWPLQGAPQQPLAWLIRVAERRYLDRLRPERRLAPDADVHLESAPAPDPSATSEGEDDQLRLLFMCCHPSLSPESRVALTLKTVAQLSVDEIGRLLCAAPSAVAQRIVRAKRSLHDVRPSFVVPEGEALVARLDDVLAVVYAIFTAGHLPTADESQRRMELCGEALRLVRLLLASPATATADGQALAALLYFTSARLPANSDAAVVSLAQQDRSRWHQRAIAMGARALAASATGTQRTRYHLEAEIACLHVTSPTYADTPWDRIVAVYDDLLRSTPTPAIQLARLVALAEAGHAAVALEELEAQRLGLERALGDWAGWPAAMGFLHERAGDFSTASGFYHQALTFDIPEPVRRFWEDARDRLGGSRAP
jgi:RNA polymerase sigma-70 factor (ECF subfamily)